MNPVYLVDTDWIIDHLNGKEKVRQKLKELRPSGIAISMVSLAELYEGVYYSNDPAKSQSILDALTGQFSIIGIDEETCKIFGKQRGKLRQEGNIINDFDLMIASTCLRKNLTLLTNNSRHFERIDGLKTLSLSPK
jgi:tRNA(fMet)-specific endonuclease VapC